MRNKVPLGLDMVQWRPSVLPAQIVLVSTLNPAGEPDLALKTGVTLAAPAGPVIAFASNTQDTTYHNITINGEFVINIPGEALAKRVWTLTLAQGNVQENRAGLTLSPAAVVRAPIIEECRAHLECRLDSTKNYGEEAVVFGRVVAASMDADCQMGTPPEQYFELRPAFFLEDRTYGTIDGAKWVDAERLTTHQLFVVQVGQPSAGRDENVIRDHLAFLRGLSSKGRLLLGGPFVDTPGGIYVLSAPTPQEAEATVSQDPLVRAGAPHDVRAWIRTF